MRRLIITFFFLYVFCFCNQSFTASIYSQENINQENINKAKEYYNAGEEKLKKGKEAIKEGNNLLLYYTTMENFEELIGKEKRLVDTSFYIDLITKAELRGMSSVNTKEWNELISEKARDKKDNLGEFLKQIKDSEIAKNNEYVYNRILKCQETSQRKIEEITDNYERGKRSLEEAIQNFKGAINSDPEFIDAYIKIIETYMELGLDVEAIKETIKTCEICQEKGFKNLTIPFSDVKKTVFKVAEICNRGIIIESKDNEPTVYNCESGEKFVNDFLRLNGERLKETFNKSKDIDGIIMNIVENDFALVEYYINIGKVISAKNEYKKVIKKYSGRLGKYPKDVVKFINNIEDSIENAKNVFFTLECEHSFIENYNKEKYNPEIGIIFLHRDDQPDNDKFNRENLVKLSFGQQNTKIGFSKNLTINNNIEDVGITLPTGIYYAKLTMSKLKVESKNVLPFKIKLDNIKLKSSKLKILGKYKDFNNNSDSSFRPIEIDLDKKDIYENKNNFKIKEDYVKFKSGNYKAEIELILDIEAGQDKSVLSLEKNTSKDDDQKVLTIVILSLVIIYAILVYSSTRTANQI